MSASTTTMTSAVVRIGSIDACATSVHAMHIDRLVQAELARRRANHVAPVVNVSSTTNAEDANAVSLVAAYRAILDAVSTTKIALFFSFHGFIVLFLLLQLEQLRELIIAESSAIFDVANSSGKFYLKNILF